MKPRSKRDLERLQAEAARAVGMLAAIELEARAHQNHQRADAVGSVKRDLAKALKGERTGFDWAGGRGQWLEGQKAA
jgi:hypothetical protein